MNVANTNEPWTGARAYLTDVYGHCSQAQSPSDPSRQQMANLYQQEIRNVANSQIGKYDQQQQQPLIGVSNFANLLNGGAYTQNTTEAGTAMLARGLERSVDLHQFAQHHSREARRVALRKRLEKGIKSMPYEEWSELFGELLAMDKDGY